MKSSEQKSNTNWTILFIAWLIASIATLGSLFFSEVMEFAPCVMCWYQRIFLYPLVITLAIGLFPLDKNTIKYSLPLAVAGWFFALYHTLLYSGFIPESIQPCRQGVSCTEVYIELFGFLSIPMLSLIAFSVIILLIVMLKRRLSE
ncbi:MAG TPA: disulfide bond formation protein B [Deltaproteobacteria bacterium]|nr:disulfide bond formation protein B [Deltaproteobacteria bacterium]